MTRKIDTFNQNVSVDRFTNVNGKTTFETSLAFVCRRVRR